VQTILLLTVETRDRPEQPPGVRVLRVVEERTLRGSLDHAARVHDDDLVRDVRNDSQVVGDQDHRRVELVLQAVDQLDDLRLDRHVERRRRLVRDQHVRVARERHRDHRALAHSARKLVWIIVDARLRIRNADLLQQVDCASARLFLVGPLVNSNRLGDLHPDGVHRVQRGHRVLEDHRHLVAANVLQLVLVHLEHVSTLVEHLTAEGRVAVSRQAEQRHRSDALPRAGLSHDAEHLAALQLEAHTVDSIDHTIFCVELDLEVLYFDQALSHLGWPDPWVEVRIYEVDEDAEEDDEERGVDRHAHDRWQVEALHGVGGILTHSLQIEDRLGQDRAPAEHGREVETEERDDRDQGVPQDVLDHHPPRRQSLGFGGADVVLVDRVEDVAPQDAAVEADEQHGEHPPRHQQMHEPLPGVDG